MRYANWMGQAPVDLEDLIYENSSTVPSER